MEREDWIARYERDLAYDYILGEFWHVEKGTEAVVNFVDDDRSTDLYISWTEGDDVLHSERVTVEQVERMLSDGILSRTNEPDGY